MFYCIEKGSKMEKRIDEIEMAIADLDRTVEELNSEVIRLSRIVERLERENKSLKETIGGNVKPLSEETPPPQ